MDLNFCMRIIYTRGVCVGRGGGWGVGGGGPQFMNNYSLVRRIVVESAQIMTPEKAQHVTVTSACGDHAR